MPKKNKNVKSLLKELKRLYSGVDCALDHKNPLELIVATILSAQCTDVRVNIVTKSLFKKYKTVQDYAAAPVADLEKLIHSTGFYRNKSKSIKGMAQGLIENFHGEVPQSLEELITLPGVARKTANVVLGVAFRKAEGVVVDTHVSRLSQRLGLSTKSDVKKIEKNLMRVIPKEDWIWISHALITHGRKVCMARNPDCLHCPIRKNCANPALK